MGDDDKPTVLAPVNVDDLTDRQLSMATHTVVMDLTDAVGKIRDHIEPDRYDNPNAPLGLREVDRDHETRLATLEKHKKKTDKHEAAGTRNAGDFISSLSTREKFIAVGVISVIFGGGGASLQAVLKLLDLVN